MKKLSKWMKVVLSLVLAIALVIPMTAYAAEEKRVDIYGDALYCYIGEAYNLGCEIIPGESATEEDLTYTWKSGDSAVLKCDEHGNYEAIAAGTTTLTVTTASGLTDTIPVTVMEPLKWDGEKTETIIFNSRFTQRIYELTVPEDGFYRFSADAVEDYNGGIALVVDDDYYSRIFDAYVYDGVDEHVYLEADETYLLGAWSYGGSWAFDLTLSKDATAEEEQDEIFAQDSMTISIGETLYLPALSGMDGATFVSSDETVVDLSDVEEAGQEGSVLESSVIAIGQKLGTATITATTEDATDTLEVEVVEVKELTEEEVETITLGGGIIGKVFVFTPEEDASYSFQSIIENAGDTYAYLYDEAVEEINHSDDGDRGTLDFDVREDLKAGETYYLYVTTYEATQNDFNVDAFETQIAVGKVEAATNVTLSLGDYLWKDGDTYYVYPGSNFYFNVVYGESMFATWEPYSFKSDNEGVVYEDSDYGWYAKEEGTANLTVTSDDNGFTDTITIKVVDEFVAGDLNLDGVIGSADINLILGVINGTVEMKDVYYQAEVNGDNKIDEKDIAALVTSAELVKEPTKLTYTQGEAFDTTGMELKVTFVDGNVETVTNGFIVSGYDAAKEGTQKVTVSYGNETFSFDVTVVKPSPATGDVSMTMVWVIAMMLCVGYAVLTYKKRRTN